MKTMFYLCFVAFAVSLGGCCKNKTETAAATPASGCPRVVSADEMSTQTSVFPGQSANMISLKRIMPAQISAGQSFDYDIIVSNLTDSQISEVTVTENVGEEFQFKAASPEGKLKGRQIVWTIDSLAPKASQKITVTGMVEKAGKLAQCADVRYRMPACSTVEVVSPHLALTKTVPSDILLCDKIPIKYTVTNTGTGVARNVIITDHLPDGLLTLDGGKLVALDSCPLGAGQSQEFSVMVRAERPGEYTSTAVAKADGDLTAESAGDKIMVHEPSLTVSENAPEKEYLGRPIKYEITVTNTGDAPAAKTILQKQLPNEAKFVSATDGGNFARGTVSWDIGTLAPQSSKTVELVYTADAAGIMKTSTQAIAECAETAISSAQTQVSGVSGILLEMWDVADPIIVGETETYEIKVTNQGSATNTNIKVIAHLENTMQYISSSGVTMGELKGSDIVFESLPNLAPKAAATWTIKVKALTPGDMRFGVDLTSDQLTRPVMKTEATTFYK